MKLELDMTDYVSEATMKGEELKLRIKRLRNALVLKEKLMFAWALVATLLAFCVGFLGAFFFKD